MKSQAISNYSPAPLGQAGLIPASVAGPAFLYLITVGWVLLVGKDLSWDVLNHHLYLPFEWITGRIHSDLFGAGPQSYQNPLGYLPFYALVAHNYPSWVIGIVLASVHAMNGILAWRIAARLW